MKCRYCFTKFKAGDLVCGVCKIAPSKHKKALTPSEKRTANRCRTLYTMGFLNIVGSVMALFLLLPAIFFYLGGQQNRNLASPSTFLLFYVVSMLILIVLFPIFGLALRKYKKQCYITGIVLYAFLILLHLPDFNPFLLLIMLLFLYWHASPPSREILAK